jgi:hypothetical protein
MASGLVVTSRRLTMPAGHGVGLSIKKKLVRTLPKQLEHARPVGRSAHPVFSLI